MLRNHAAGLLLFACFCTCGTWMMVSDTLGQARDARRAAEERNTPTIIEPTDSTQAQTGNSQRTATEWLSYGGDKASTKYSPLDQIGTDNFSRLKVAWMWRSADEVITKANPDLKNWV